MKGQRIGLGMILWAASAALALLLGPAIPRQAAARSAPVPSLQAIALAQANAGWDEVGPGSAAGDGISGSQGGYAPAIAIAPDRTAYVAWMGDDGTDGEIYIRRWNGSAWVEVGAGSATGGGVSDNDWGSSGASLAIAPDGTPYLAWDERYQVGGEPAQHVYAWRWNGSAWEQVGAGPVSHGVFTDSMSGSTNPAIAIASDGTPYVAWYRQNDNGSYIYVRRWNGSAWVNVGDGTLGGGGLGENSVAGVPAIAAAPDGKIYVAWNEHVFWKESGEIYVLRWSGTAWEQVGAGSDTGGGISNSGEHSGGVSVAVATDGTPYLAWVDESGSDSEIYVRRWNGSAWAEVGAGSATGGGISNDDLDSDGPTVAVAPDGTPYVAWQNQYWSGGDLYVRRWNGTVWEEAGDGSAAGGGVSDNDSSSEGAALAMDPDGRPWLAWSDDGGGSYGVYVRRWDPGSVLWLPILFKQK